MDLLELVEGKNSTFILIFEGRKRVSPYTTRDGKRMLDGAGDILLQGNNVWADQDIMPNLFRMMRVMIDYLSYRKSDILLVDCDAR